MKKLFTFLALAFCLFAFQANAQDRYVDEIFDNVTVTDGILYGANASVITGAPVKQNLFFDFYEPTGDTGVDRPLVIYFHTGNFLPNPTNGSTSGTKKDSTIVEICTRLAKMGYAVAVPDYRLGWNPISMVQEVRVNTLINAAYRGVQDANTIIRFFKKSFAEDGNAYGIDPDKITLWGQGTGGYITYATNTIDTYNDIVLNKFIGGNGFPMVIESINGDPFATTVGTNPMNGDTLCFTNHLGYDSDIALAVNTGGAMGDTSWLDAGDQPMISFQVPDDPFAPYMEDILIVPTTGEQIVEVQGAYLVQQKANDLGINDAWTTFAFDDDYTASADANNNGFEGLFPFIRPTWPNPLNPAQMVSEVAPWEWWDAAFWGAIEHPSCGGIPPPACSFHVINSINNPDMSAEKARGYIDSLIGYFTPRACITLELDCNLSDFTSTKEVLSTNLTGLAIAPNPATDYVIITSNADYRIIDLGLYDISGNLVQFHQGVDSNKYQLERNNLPPGMYIAKVRFEDGISSSKLMFN